MLFDCPGYLYQGLVTNLPRTQKPVAVWREYNGRAACENIIKELDAGYGLPELACKDFWGTEAALSLGVLAHNLIVLLTQTGMAGGGDHWKPALLDLRYRRSHQSGARTH